MGKSACPLGKSTTYGAASLQQHTVGDFQGYLKFNVDASLFVSNGATGWGWCIRDHLGRFILTGSNFIHERLNTIEGETLALKEAIHEVIQRGLSHVTFENDSKIVVDAIASGSVGTSEFSMLISQIKL
jgi:ribonuclease HI